MDNYFTTTDSIDVTFCISNCKNTKCSRHTRGKLFGIAMARPYYSSAKFADSCKSYLGSDK